MKYALVNAGNDPATVASLHRTLRGAKRAMEKAHSEGYALATVKRWEPGHDWPGRTLPALSDEEGVEFDAL